MLKDFEKKQEILEGKEGINLNNPSDLVFKLLEGLSPRTKNVIIKRFGLDGQEKQTLEKIGRAYGITRERVRQIESSTLKEFKKPKKIVYLKSLEDRLEELFHEHGKIMEHKNLVKTFKEKVDDKKLHANHLEFLLTLSPRFDNIKEDEVKKEGWIIKGADAAAHNKLIQSFCDVLEKEKKPLPEDHVLTILENHQEVKNLQNVAKNRKAILSYLNLSKKVLKNPFGEWGMRDWSEVVPRGVKDKAYLILKKAEKPLHFRQITDLINEKKFSDKKANYQTVHNELIKDKRFVLIGRGIYALVEWGYHPGTVAEVVLMVLKEAKNPLSRNEIIDRVLKQRQVKKNTIVLALQNKEKFERVREGMYKLKM